jgi:hypothetical protein
MSGIITGIFSRWFLHPYNIVGQMTGRKTRDKDERNFDGKKRLRRGTWKTESPNGI